jgi:hypothetical protein
MFLFVLAFFALSGLLSLIPHSAVHSQAAVHRPPYHPGPWFFAAMPFVEGALGFLFTALFCWVYNRIVGFTGGIELDVIKLCEVPAPSSHDR